MKNDNEIKQKLDNIALLLTNEEIQEAVDLMDTLQLLQDDTSAQLTIIEAEVISNQQVINLN